MAKAITYETAQSGSNLVTYYTGTDSDVDSQWTQLTQNAGLLLDGVTTVTKATEYNPATIDANGRCTGGTVIGTFVAPGTPVIVITGATGSKAIPTPSGADQLVRITKSSAATDLTIAAPTVGTDDGKTVTIVDETGHAHVVTCSTDGFNAKGSSGTATFGGTKGDAVILRADNGHWWAVANTGVTIA